MTRPFFSIIIPAYNAHETISACLNSVLSQDYEDYEIVIIDDGSKDSTKDVIDTFINKRIRYFRKENGGASSARNYGINKALGKWIIFLDSDDTIEAKSLRKLNTLIANNSSADFIVTPVKSVTPNNKNTHLRQEKATLIDKKDAINSIIFNMPSSPLYIPRCPGGKVIKHELITKHHLLFDERLKLFEDGVFNIEALCCSKQVLFCNLYLYNYNKNNPGSQSNTFYPDIARNDDIVYQTIGGLLEKMGYASPSFPYLCLELFFESSFAASREKVKTKEKIQKIKKYYHIYSKHFAGYIRLEDAYKTLKVVYLLCRIGAYRSLLAFYNLLYKSLKRRRKF